MSKKTCGTPIDGCVINRIHREKEYSIKLKKNTQALIRAHRKRRQEMRAHKKKTQALIRAHRNKIKAMQELEELKKTINSHLSKIIFNDFTKKNGNNFFQPTDSSVESLSEETWFIEKKPIEEWLIIQPGTLFPGEPTVSWRLYNDQLSPRIISGPKDIVSDQFIRARDIVKNMLDTGKQTLVTMDGHGRFVRIFYYLLSLFKKQRKYSHIELCNFNIILYEIDPIVHQWHEIFMPTTVENRDRSILDHEIQENELLYLNFCGLGNQVSSVRRYLEENIATQHNIFLSFSERGIRKKKKNYTDASKFSRFSDKISFSSNEIFEKFVSSTESINKPMYALFIVNRGTFRTYRFMSNEILVGLRRPHDERRRKKAERLMMQREEERIRNEINKNKKRKERQENGIIDYDSDDPIPKKKKTKIENND